MREIPDILQRICEKKQEEIEGLRPDESRLRDLAEQVDPPRDFRNRLMLNGDVALIAEVKKASPSAGLIRDDFNPTDIAKAYERGGAHCISVLTDEPFFQGCPEYLQQVKAAVKIPILRKEFILDPIQVVQSRSLGADCVLLIVACLSRDQLSELLGLAGEWGLDALVEAHDTDELEIAKSCGAELIGINNRNLRTFEVDLSTTQRLAADLPAETVLVSESGISGPEDIEQLKQCGVDAVLVGELLMRSEDIEGAVRRLSGI
ncbi:MAG: indole-3-glycerol phosphate synthase TrpC [Candidatus Brocadiia bacterium]